MTTIDPHHAAALYALLADDGAITPDLPPDSVRMVDGWVLLGSAYSRQTDRHDWYWLVLERAGQVWGVEYGIGLTDDQEDDLPWEGTAGPVLLVPLWTRSPVSVEYCDAPAVVDAQPARGVL